MKIDIQNLVHEYPSGTRALNGVSLTIEHSEPVAIIGQNGAGKTTLVKHLNGLLQATQGRVLLDGVDVNEHETADWATTVGYVFQNPDDQLFSESVRKEFAFGPKQIGASAEDIAARTERMARLVGLEDKLDYHPFDLNSTEKKFCTIGAVLMMNPQAIVFDEPTCGQDVRGARRLGRIIQSLRSEGKLCITISHDMKFVTKNFSRVIVMCSGAVLLDGSPKEVFAQPELLERTFVTPPPITRVCQGAGMSGTAFTLDEFVGLFLEERGRHIR